MSHALTGFLADKSNLTAAGLTRDMISAALEAQSVGDDLTARALACLDWADSGRFAPVAAGRRAEELVEEAALVIEALGEEIGEARLQ